jgi:hypothetical protein
MNIEAFDWNVIVIGFWNRAILNPAGIVKRLFGLESDTPVLIEVPMDILAVPRVKHDGLVVSVSHQRLIIGSDKPIYAALDRARAMAVKGIRSLPETPLQAAGFNFRFKIDDPTEDLLNSTKLKIDDFISDAAFEIKGRTVRRSLKWNEGIINLNIIQNENTTVEMNFDRQSLKQDELVNWLEHPISDVTSIVEKIFADVIKISLGEIGKK